MKNTKTRYLVNFGALVLLFAAVVLMSLLGGRQYRQAQDHALHLAV